MCKCGCDSCNTTSTALVLNENLAPKTILSEGLKFHMDNNRPLIKHLYKVGSKRFFNLIAEARSLYSRGILSFSNPADIAIITNTNLGEFGIFEQTWEVSKRRAGAELKQKIKGVRSDGFGKYEGKIFGLDDDGKRVELKDLNDLNKFSKFELGECKKVPLDYPILNEDKSYTIYTKDPKTLEVIKEELCKKGKNYIAKRKRAGEKSSAYLSGRAVRVCKGQIKAEGEGKAAPYGSGYKKVNLDKVVESLRDWFKKEDWVRINTSGNISGDCGTMKKGKATTRCLPRAKANNMSKSERKATVAKKTRGSKKGKQFVSVKENLLKEDRFIVMWRRKDIEDLKKKGFDPEYPAFAPEAVKKGGWNEGREFMVNYGDYETPKDRAKAHAEKLAKEDGDRVEYGVHLQRDNTRFEEGIVEEVRTQDLKEFINFLKENCKPENIQEAKYQGRTVQLNKPMRGDSKKFKVYVNSGKKNADGTIKVKKVEFGAKGMNIKKNNPKRRKAFRARHNCANPGPKTKARYWSCRKW